MNRTDDRHLSGQVVRYATSGVARHFLSLLTSFVRAKVLSPELYGLWVLLKTFPTYGQHMHLGSHKAMYYRLPRLLAEEKIDQAEAIEATSFWGMLGLNLLFCVAIVISVAWADMDETLELGLLLSCPAILLTSYYEYMLDRLRALRQFDRIGNSHYLFAVVSLVLTVALVWLYGLPGVVVAVSLTLVITLAYLLHGQRTWWPRSGFDGRLFVELVRMGLPIVIVAVMQVLMMTIDRFLIVAYLDAVQLGLYGLASIVMVTAMRIPSASREVIEPETMAQSHAHNEVGYFDRFYGKPLLYIAFLMPFMIGGAVFALEPVLRWVLPEYLDAVAATQVMLWGSYFLALTYASRGVIVAAELQFRLALYALLPLALGFGLSWMALRAGYGIEAVALVKGLSFAAFYIVINLALFQRYPHFGAAISRYLAITLALFVYMVVIGSFCLAWTLDIPAFWQAVARMLLFYLAMGGPLAVALRQDLIRWPVRKKQLA